MCLGADGGLYYYDTDGRLYCYDGAARLVAVSSRISTSGGVYMTAPSTPASTERPAEGPEQVDFFALVDGWLDIVQERNPSLGAVLSGPVEHARRCLRAFSRETMYMSIGRPDAERGHLPNVVLVVVAKMVLTGPKHMVEVAASGRALYDALQAVCDAECSARGLPF